jgi:hypothetical protein
MNDHFPQMPPGGKGTLRAMLASLKEGQAPFDRLEDHPLYKEGYDDGYQAALANHKKLASALAKVYNINEDS